ncbi:hypothetical protein D3C72_2006240 [compost metagenome]
MLEQRSQHRQVQWFLAQRKGEMVERRIVAAVSIPGIDSLYAAIGAGMRAQHPCLVRQLRYRMQRRDAQPEPGNQGTVAEWSVSHSKLRREVMDA